jgi:hypothetical protein
VRGGLSPSRAGYCVAYRRDLSQHCLTVSIGEAMCRYVILEDGFDDEPGAPAKHGHDDEGRPVNQQFRLLIWDIAVARFSLFMGSCPHAAPYRQSCPIAAIAARPSRDASKALGAGQRYRHRSHASASSLCCSYRSWFVLLHSNCHRQEQPTHEARNSPVGAAVPPSRPRPATGQATRPGSRPAPAAAEPWGWRSCVPTQMPWSHVRRWRARRHRRGAPGSGSSPRSAANRELSHA